MMRTGALIVGVIMSAALLAPWIAPYAPAAAGCGVGDVTAPESVLLESPTSLAGLMSGVAVEDCPAGCAGVSSRTAAGRRPGTLTAGVEPVAPAGIGTTPVVSAASGIPGLSRPLRAVSFDPAVAAERPDRARFG